MGRVGSSGSNRTQSSSQVAPSTESGSLSLRVTGVDQSSQTRSLSVAAQPLALYPTLVGGIIAGANETVDWIYSFANLVYTDVPFQVGKQFTPSSDYDPARYINIGVLAFDASTLPDGLLVTSATISLFTQEGDQSTIYLRIGSWGPTL